jgi:type II secretory pathway component PulC
MIRISRIQSVAVRVIIILTLIHFIQPRTAGQESKKPEALPYSLVGIIIAKNGPACAVLKNNVTGETLFLKTRESIDGMQIIKIIEDRIILQKADTTIQIYLEAKLQKKEMLKSSLSPGLEKSTGSETDSEEYTQRPQSPLIREMTWPEIGEIMETEVPVLIRESRVIPNIVQGRFQGFKVTRLPKTNFLSHGEIQVNDIIRFINDVELDGFPTLQSLERRLKSERRLCLILERKGQRLQRTWRFKETNTRDHENSIR